MLEHYRGSYLISHPKLQFHIFLKMKKILNLTLALCLISFAASAQMSSIQTSIKNAMQGKFKTFIIMDESTGLVLGQKPKAYDPGNEMPLSYFTLLLPDEAINYIPGTPRSFIIHSLETVSGIEGQDWVLENNSDEESVFFARSKYINNEFSKQWLIMVDGQKVVFKNVRNGDFLVVDGNGDYLAVKDFAEATRWKLIYTF